MNKNEIIEMLYDVATELDRESEFVRNKIEDYESLNLQTVADYWTRELKELYSLRLGLLYEVIPFIREMRKGGDKE